MSAAQFIGQNPENGDYNQVDISFQSSFVLIIFNGYVIGLSLYYFQYWYSTYTINQMVEDCVNIGGRIAFLSTPSVYFALPDDAREKSFCFDVSSPYCYHQGLHFRRICGSEKFKDAYTNQ